MKSEYDYLRFETSPGEDLSPTEDTFFLLMAEETIDFDTWNAIDLKHRPRLEQLHADLHNNKRSPTEEEVKETYSTLPDWYFCPVCNDPVLNGSDGHPCLSPKRTREEIQATQARVNEVMKSISVEENRLMEQYRSDTPGDLEIDLINIRIERLTEELNELLSLDRFRKPD